MAHLINTISNVSYERGLVTFDLENVLPAPENTSRREPVITLAVRLEDLTQLVSFLGGEIEKMVGIEAQWHKESTGMAVEAASATSIRSTKSRPEAGRRLGP